MKLIKSFGYAYQGLIEAIKDQLNLRIQFAAAFFVILAGFYFRITAVEWAIILVTISVVISLELVNTAIENLVDLITLEKNPLAGKVKDIAAAAVLFSSLAAVVIGFVVFSKHLF
jgi:diacylglycerol kinase